MMRKSPGAWFASALVALLALSGCASKKIGGVLLPNQRPTVELTNAPTQADRSNPYFYAYKVNWSGYDADGRVDHYEFAVDPPAVGDTVWNRTTRNEETVFFRASDPDPVNGSNPRTASDFHTFIIKAFDDDGMQSVPRRRDFYAYTIAPTVQILNPTPSALLTAQVTPSVRIEWTGVDVDGQFSQKPVKYKYRMIDLSDPANVVFLTLPDSLRKYESARNWAGWDSTSADTQFVQFTNLTPGKNYLFCLIGFDEAGAYSPDFSLNSNCLQLAPGFAASNGPKIQIYNNFIDYVYQSGGYSTDPLREIPIEVPSRVPIPVNWAAIASPGSRIQSFRWMVGGFGIGGNINDQTVRADEGRDIWYWSQPSPVMPGSVLLPPFMTDGEYRFYLECSDNNGQKSLGILKMTVVTPSFDRNLLVLDDTRREVDKPISATNPTRAEYTKIWPARAELDTFLFARGGFPWRGTKNPATGVISQPGLLAGYSFDTLGTRLGLENPANGVLLSRIGKYRHLIWMLDDEGAGYLETDDQSIRPVTALYSMSGPGRASTLAAYTQLGGRVWLVGGGAAYASLRQYDRTTNNVGQTTVFSSAANFGELAPSRIMFDGAHWRSQIAITKSGIRTLRNPNTKKVKWANGTEHDTTYIVVKDPWTHHDFFTGGTLSRPPYELLPEEMRWRVAGVDPRPVTRSATASASLIYPTSFPCEYIRELNAILEDVDPDPDFVREAAVLDTLYMASGSVLLTNNPQTGQQIPAPTMTYYHGSEARQFVFSGFGPWYYKRADCMALFDFVLQSLWGMTRQPINRGTVTPAASGTSPARSVRPNPRPVNARVPAAGTGRE